MLQVMQRLHYLWYNGIEVVNMNIFVSGYKVKASAWRNGECGVVNASEVSIKFTVTDDFESGSSVCDDLLECLKKAASDFYDSRNSCIKRETN